MYGSNTESPKVLCDSFPNLSVVLENQEVDLDVERAPERTPGTIKLD